LAIKLIFKTFLFLLLFSSRGMGIEDYDQKLAKQEEELVRIREKLAQKRSEASRLEKRERSLLSQLEGVEKRLELTRALIRGLVKKERLLRGSISQLSEDLKLLRKSLGDRRDGWARRIRRIYKKGRVTDLELLFSSRSFSRLLSRGRALSLIARGDLQYLRELRARRESLLEEEKKLRAERLEVEEAEGEKENEECALRADYNRRLELLQKVKREKENYTQAIRDLESSSKEIQRIIDDLQRQRREYLAKGSFAVQKGQLPWPVEGKVVSKFGRHLHPVFKTVTFNEGVEIEAPLGVQVRSVFDGKVLYEGWLRGYGRFLIISHGSGYYTLYAHLLQVLVDKGEEVRKEDPVALLGETGSVSGPLLHFEVRKGRERLDPLIWLKKR
jgi:septal ring factor EnvC (AmiA/AmiB activator)